MKNMHVYLNQELSQDTSTSFIHIPNIGENNRMCVDNLACGNNIINNCHILNQGDHMIYGIVCNITGTQTHLHLLHIYMSHIYLLHQPTLSSDEMIYPYPWLSD